MCLYIWSYAFVFCLSEDMPLLAFAHGEQEICRGDLNQTHVLDYVQTKSLEL